MNYVQYPHIFMNHWVCGVVYEDEGCFVKIETPAATAKESFVPNFT
jgi:hypothetical protein